MTSEDRKNGWWEMPALDGWICPECHQESPVDDWAEVEPGCEDCGNHDGRECPVCGAWFDHVFVIHELLEANRAG